MVFQSQIEVVHSTADSSTARTQTFTLAELLGFGRPIFDSIWPPANCGGPIARLHEDAGEDFDLCRQNGGAPRRLSGRNSGCREAHRSTTPETIESFSYVLSVISTERSSRPSQTVVGPIDRRLFPASGVIPSRLLIVPPSTLFIRAESARSQQIFALATRRQFARCMEKRRAGWPTAIAGPANSLGEFFLPATTIPPQLERFVPQP